MYSLCVHLTFKQCNVTLSPLKYLFLICSGGTVTFMMYIPGPIIACSALKLKNFTWHLFPSKEHQITAEFHFTHFATRLQLDINTLSVLNPETTMHAFTATPLLLAFNISLHTLRVKPL